MARSTVSSDTTLAPPRGLKRFRVIRSTIKDDEGNYCAPGDLAALGKASAKHYLDLNLIRVELPEFDDEKTPASQGDKADASKD